MAQPIELQPQAITVQELAAINSRQVPERYIREGVGALDASFPVLDVPTIDLQLLASSSSTSGDELDKLRSALSSYGCIQGILNDYSTKLHVILEVLLKAMARSLNLEENQFLQQYGDQATMQARCNFYPICPRPDQVLGVKPHADGSVITMLLQDKEVEGLQVLKDDQWFNVPIIPQALLINIGDQAENYFASFRQSIMELQVHFWTNCEKLLANSLLFQSEEKKKYSREIGSIEGYGNDMILSEDQILDWTDRLYLILRPEDKQTLKFWPENPESFIMSNGIFKSPVHRVVTNSERERITVAVFCIPHPDQEIQPVEELINETHPRLYKKVKDYVSLYFQYYQQGRRPMEAALI
ncbi:hypothetical protein GOBAR_DD03962 [Gossypium barbadense]|nr:hypothetical protein GOBAR_DD03962 [Gossypium barbadense]